VESRTLSVSADRETKAVRDCTLAYVAILRHTHSRNPKPRRASVFICLQEEKTRSGRRGVDGRKVEAERTLPHSRRPAGLPRDLVRLAHLVVPSSIFNNIWCLKVCEALWRPTSIRGL
jgi:hypothetical protein